jgi:hypothetical protein
MSSRSASMTCFTGVVAVILIACSGDNSNDCKDACAQTVDSSDNSSDCKYACAQTVATGPHIEITNNGPSIAAIETLALGSISDASGGGGCAVSWSSLAVGKAQPVCSAPPVDAGWIGDGCAHRYPCDAPNGYQLDGGSSCTQAWVNMEGDSCAVTVISTTGERQTFEVAVVGTSFAYRCRTGMGQCVEIWSTQTAPSHITITFASPMGGATVVEGGVAN